MDYKQWCPECFEPLRESELKPNRALKSIYRAILDDFLPKDDVEQSKEPKVELEQEVEMCPICRVSVPRKNFSLHSAKCVQNQQEQESVKRASKKMPQMQKLVYHVLKESELRKKLRELGLDSKGTKDALIKRHKQYCLIWNSEADKENPKSKLQILSQVAQWEREQKVPQIMSRNIFSTSKTHTNSEALERKKKEYLHENKNSFDKLIEKAAKNKRKNRNHEVENDESCATYNANCCQNEDIAILEPLVEIAEEAEQQDEVNPSESQTTFEALEKNETEYLHGHKNSSGKHIEKASNNGRKNQNHDLDNDESCDTYNTNSSQSENINILEPLVQVKEEPIEVNPLKRRFSSSSSSSSPSLIPGTPKSTPKRFKQHSIESALNTQSQRPAKTIHPDCPVCGQPVAMKFMDSHLDRCLKGESGKRALSRKKSSTYEIPDSDDDDFKTRPSSSSTTSTTSSPSQQQPRRTTRSTRSKKR